MKPLVSILLPTFKRPNDCLNCILTIRDSADNPDRVEFCLRFQADDTVTTPEHRRLLESEARNFKSMVGESHGGYFGNHIHYTEAASMATGEWIWLMNDDCTVHGKGWDTRLERIHKGRIVIPSVHKLGHSTYLQDSDCGAFIIPNGEITSFQFPPDKYVLDTLRAKGWPTEFLDVIFHHHRSDDVEREKHYGYKT